MTFSKQLTREKVSVYLATEYALDNRGKEFVRMLDERPLNRVKWLRDLIESYIWARAKEEKRRRIRQLEATLKRMKGAKR